MVEIVPVAPTTLKVEEIDHDPGRRRIVVVGVRQRAETG